MSADAAHIVVLFIADLGMMAFLAILFGETKRYALNETFRDIALGTMFGICAVYSMVSHQTFGGAGSVDASNIFVAFAGAFLGAVGALVSLALGLGASLASGESLHWADHVDIVLAVVLGWGWRRTQKGEGPADMLSILVLGVLICLTFISYGPLLSGEDGPDWLGRTLPAVIMAFIATGILGGFIERERRLISTETMLRHDAQTDALTGLGNRRTLERAFMLQSRIAGDALHVLLLADVDHFKSINDRFGHTAGDSVLRSTADLLRRLVRTHDIVARVGGEEFAVLLQAQSRDEAMAAAERLREQIAAAPIGIGNAMINVTISIGVCCWAGHRDFARVFEAADTALYDAKRGGRNKVVVARDSLVLHA